MTHVESQGRKWYTSQWVLGDGSVDVGEKGNLLGYAGPVLLTNAASGSCNGTVRWEVSTDGTAWLTPYLAHLTAGTSGFGTGFNFGSVDGSVGAFLLQQAPWHSVRARWSGTAGTAVFGIAAAAI